MNLKNLFKRNRLKEIQDLTELGNIPIGETVVYMGVKIRVKEYDHSIGCEHCCLRQTNHKACHLVACTISGRPDGKSVIYIKIN